MELKHIIPNMEQTFGQLEFAGEGKIEQRRINGRPTILTRCYNLYSTIQRADDIAVILPQKLAKNTLKSMTKLDSLTHALQQKAIRLVTVALQTMLCTQTIWSRRRKDT